MHHHSRVMATLCGRAGGARALHLLGPTFGREDESEHISAPCWERSLEMEAPALWFTTQVCYNQLQWDPLKSRRVGVKKKCLCQVPY